MINHHELQDSVINCTADAVSVPPVDPLLLLLNLRYQSFGKDAIDVREACPTKME